MLVLRPYAARRAQQLARKRKPVRLHLACGVEYKEGWINIDLVRPGGKLDLVWDLRWGLPFEDDSVDAIFSEHLLEHLSWRDGLELLRKCEAALRPGGTLRFGVPDLGRYVASYFGRDSLIETFRPGRPTRAMALNEIYYGYRHRYMYDDETLKAFLEAVGFGDIQTSTFRSGVLGEADTEKRAAETLYVEAVKQ